MGLLTPIPNNVLTSLLNYFKSRYETKFNAANTASGLTTVTINATSGVATFTQGCALAPDITTYSINNSLITENSIVSVNVQGGIDSFCTLISVQCQNGSMIISVNDIIGSGFPIISFQILG